MQSVHASWAGKTSALARCCDSRDKKPRSRRSKEERKTMVESFIKKYQNLNNGKFPSLNLTHKEVGGSFYTVREIVREIIQENRVLVPGYSTSKALNLEYCPQEQGTESLSVDISSPLSISTINYAVNQPQGESLSLYNQYMIERDESVNQEGLECHSNVAIVSQVLDGEKSENLSYEGHNLGKLSGVTNANSGICDQTHAEVQVHSSDVTGKFEHPFPSCDAVSVAPFQFESVVNGDDNGNKTDDMIKEMNSSETSGPHTLSDRSSEAIISLDSVPPFASLCGRDDPPLASGSVKTCNAGQSQNRIDVTASLKVPKTSESDEMRVTFMPFENDPAINRSETTEILSSTVVDEAADRSRQLSVEKDFDMNRSEKAETLSSIAVDEVSNGSFNGSVSHNLDSHALEITSPLVHTLLQPNDSKNVIANFKSAPGELVQPRYSEKTLYEVEHHHEHALGNAESARSYGSVTKNEVRKESEAPEANPVWKAIKSLLNSVVKFWME